MFETNKWLDSTRKIHLVSLKNVIKWHDSCQWLANLTSLWQLRGELSNLFYKPHVGVFWYLTFLAYLKLPTVCNIVLFHGLVFFSIFFFQLQLMAMLGIIFTETIWFETILILRKSCRKKKTSFSEKVQLEIWEHSQIIQPNFTLMMNLQE